MKCRLGFHHWDKWKVIQIIVQHWRPGMGKASEMQADRQERECLRCGLKQRRELR
jgi:hypothetical protein